MESFMLPLSFDELNTKFEKNKIQQTQVTNRNETNILILCSFLLLH